MLKLKALVIANEQQTIQHEQDEIEKKKLLEHEKELMAKHQRLQAEQKSARLLTDEGTRRLEKSLDTGDFTDAQAAHSLIRSGNEKLASISEQMAQTMDDLVKLQQKRTYAEHEQSKKKQKLTHYQSIVEHDKKVH